MLNEQSEVTTNDGVVAVAATEDALLEPLLPQQQTNNENKDKDNTTNADAEPFAALDPVPPSHHPRHHLSRNIYLTLWFQGIRCAGEAVWNNSILTAYVYLLRPNHPATIGYLSAIEGIAQFIAAALSGIIADIYRRDSLLKVSSFVGIAASLITYL